MMIQFERASATQCEVKRFSFYSHTIDAAAAAATTTLNVIISIDWHNYYTGIVRAHALIGVVLLLQSSSAAVVVVVYGGRREFASRSAYIDIYCVRLLLHSAAAARREH